VLLEGEGKGRRRGRGKKEDIVGLAVTLCPGKQYPVIRDIISYYKTSTGNLT